MGRWRWNGWRRDLLAGLVGALIAAGVLVPIGWSRVIAERERLRAEQERARAYQEEVEREQTVRTFLSSLTFYHGE